MDQLLPPSIVWPNSVLLPSAPAAMQGAGFDDAQAAALKCPLLAPLILLIVQAPPLAEFWAKRGAPLSPTAIQRIDAPLLAHPAP